MPNHSLSCTSTVSPVVHAARLQLAANKLAPNLDRVAEQHGDGHGAHTSGYGCDGTRNLGALLIVTVAHQPVLVTHVWGCGGEVWGILQAQV